MSDHSYQKDPASSMNSTMQVSGIVSKSIQWVGCVAFISSSIWSIVSVWPQLWHVVGGSRDKIWALVRPIRSRIITTSSALVKCWIFFGGPSVGFKRYRCLPCTAISHLVWTSCWIYELTNDIELENCTLEIITKSTKSQGVNWSPPGHNGCHCASDVVRCIFLNEKCCIWIEMPQKFFPSGPIYNNPAFVQIIACRWLSERNNWRIFLVLWGNEFN